MKKNPLRPFFIICGLLLVGLSAFWLSSGKINTPLLKDSDRINITTSFYPLADFTEQVGGDKVSVFNLTPAGVEPHDFEPTPGDIVQIQNSTLFIYNGVGFEPWVDNVISDLADSKVQAIDSSQGISLLAGSDDDHDEDEEDEPDSLFDPHFWLDPVLASQQVDNIATGLSAVDPENSDFYQKNARAYKQELAQLDQDFQTGLLSCSSRNVIASHNAFTYLADRYNLNLIPLTGLSPDDEPSPRELAQIADFARDNNVSHIFFETLVSPRLAETIAREIGATTLVLNPLEGLTPDEVSQGENYLSIQRQNLANLKIALNCK